MHFRLYLKTPDGLRRLPVRVIDDNVPLPQFANMTLPCIPVTVVDGELRILEPLFLRCDASGDWVRNNRDDADLAIAINMHAADKSFFRDKSVADLAQVRNAKHAKTTIARQKYTLSQTEADAIAGDMAAFVKHTPIPILKVGALGRKI